MLPNLLLVRGLIRESGHWYDWLDRVRDSGLWKEIRTIDLPGVGTEFRRDSPRSIDEILKDTSDRLTDFEDGFDVLAVSMGGMLMLRWGEVLGWHRFNTLALVNTSARDVAPFWKRLNARNLPTILKLFVVNDILEREDTILKLTAQNLENPRRLDYLRYAVKLGRERPISRTNAANQLIAAARFEAPKEVAVPLFVAVGTQDRLVSPECSQALARRYGVEPQLFEGAGHDIVLEDPDAFWDRWSRFIQDYRAFGRLPVF